jgi:DNA-directed RNA polymerase subunit RPC12/RpoP
MLYSQSNNRYNCPQCGDELGIHFKYSKLVKCPSCSSSIFLEDDHVKLIGQSSVLSPEPSLIQLYQPFEFQDIHYTPLGKIRYSYGRGFWEEWFIKSENNKALWLSIDEGDFVLQEKMSLSLPFKSSTKFQVGTSYGNYTVTEIGTGTCVGFEGELPEKISINEEHKYIHLSQGHGNLVTIEFNDNETETYKGKWIDPLKIKVKN